MRLADPGVLGACTRADHIDRRAIAVVAHRVLEIPHVELEARAVGGAVAAEPEILVGPVPVSSPDVRHHVVDVVELVQIHREGGVARAVRIVALHALVVGVVRGGLGKGDESVEGVEIATLHVACIVGIPLQRIAAIVGRGEIFVRSFDQIVETPIDAVEIQVHESSVGTGVSHGQVEVLSELHPDKLFGILGGVPRVTIIGTGTQHEAVELGHRIFTFEQVMVELAHAVLALEQNAQRMLLRDAGLAEVAALDAKTGILLKLCVAVCIDQLNGGWSFPRNAVTVWHGVNTAGGIEQIGDAGADEHRGKRVQRRHHLSGVRQGDARVHRVIGGHPSPRVWIAGVGD